MSNRITVGFIPLVDCAPLVVAARKGFAAAEGIDLVLVRETSWASIRDRVAVGHFDGAHMLAPMALAANLGLQPLAAPIVVPMALGLGGNAITVSNALWQDLLRHGAGPGIDASRALSAFGRCLVERSEAGRPKPVLAIVHQHSAHNYELRYWLAAGGIDPDLDVALVSLPPPLMASALASGHVDGFCVGEPWSSVAVARGAGRIVTTKSEIWRSGPDKVLGMRADRVKVDVDVVAALVRAVNRAARWCDEPANRVQLAEILSQGDVLAQPAGIVLQSLSGHLALGCGGEADVEDFVVFSRRAATFPWISHALWFFSQMVRWGDVALTPQTVEAARATYRPDLYRAAVAALGGVVPATSSKVEGALAIETAVASIGGYLSLGPDTFFDGRRFDPDDVAAYVANGRP